MLYNRLTDEAGTGSAVADFPNGGLVVMVGNILHKGPRAQNTRVVAYGMEGLAHERNALNVFSNDTNEPCLKALENYWRLFAARYRGRNTIWAYDLRNEPHLAWDTPCLRMQWAAWRRAHHQDLAPVPDPKAHSVLTRTGRLSAFS